MQEFEEQWQIWSQDMINGLYKWLQTHPQASLQETGLILTSLEKYQWRSQSTGGEEMDVEIDYGNGTCPGCGAKLLP